MREKEFHYFETAALGAVVQGCVAFHALSVQVSTLQKKIKTIISR
jgi:phage protein D